MQAWFTGTDRTLFESLNGRAQFCTVADGIVEQEPAITVRRTGTE
jgi:hypothetical protein